ncbi:MAG TPA: hypothetical protein VGB37_16475 [Candidatus Lokiarchaeia archaeon]
MNTKILFALILILFVSFCVSLIFYSETKKISVIEPYSQGCVDYFYLLTCPHCQGVRPLVDTLRKEFPSWKWTYHNIEEEEEDIPAVPLIKIKTYDNRNISLIGSDEIARWLKCELAQQSSLECPTYTKDYNHQTNSWFVR